MRVLVLGATGFIGSAAADAINRHGHITLGQTRSSSSASQLQAREITPVVGDLADLGQLLESLSPIDVIVDCSGGSDINVSLPRNVKIARAYAQKARPHGPALTFIAVSGTWIHGDNRQTTKTDGDPITEPIDLTAWRREWEQDLVGTKSASFRGIVVRASLLYGGDMSVLSSVFSQARTGHIIWKGSRGGYLATIHQTDLGECLALAVSKAPLIAGLILDASNPTPESADVFLAELQCISGAKSLTYEKATTAFEKAVQTTGLLAPTLARDLLGWHPVKRSLIHGLDTYYATYLATQKD